MNTENVSTEEKGNGILAVVTGSLPYVEFPDDNKIIFYQDHNWWEGVPSKTKFYIDSLSSDGVWLVADGYGILQGNKFGFTGRYGNGKICIDFKNLNDEIEKFCRANCQ